MSKTPTPSEWWLRNSDGRIFYICGFDPEGWVVHYNENVGLYTLQMRYFCKDFRHQPRCTGFGWVEPPAEIDPGEGYELLPVGGRLERYDQVLWSGMTGPTWVDTAYFGEYVGSRPGLEGPYRRKIKAVEPPEEDPNDMPLNPVPGKVVATGTVTFTPVKPTACVACGVNWALDGSVSCRECYEHAIEATGVFLETPDDMAAIIAEHTQQVRELTQRIGELAQQVNERDGVIEKIRAALRQDFSV